VRRLRFQVAYDGTDFHGWQVQPGLPTIQGTLEEVISILEGAPVQVAGSGRTDAGVHALAQVAAVSLANPIPPQNFRWAVNRRLPRSIRICDVQEVEPQFHPRFDAVSKLYEYRIFREEICPPFDRNLVYHHPFPLDESLMGAAAANLVGEYDFTAFAAVDESDRPDRSKVRRIIRSTLMREGPRLVYQVSGSGFLKHMVRNIVGVLLLIGRGTLTLDDLQARLKPNSGIPPGPTAPPSGLYLHSVTY
jgi:tRNA pseudouridine38-40 synthase